MSQDPVFAGALVWTGAATQRDGALALGRRYTLEFPGKAPIEGASPAAFKGDDAFHNPETLMVASLAACHHLTYLAVCERAGIALAAYTDLPAGRLGMKDGKMRMVEVVLRPRVVVQDASQVDTARAAHDKAHAHCFMANSVNFEVRVEPEIVAAAA